MDTKNETIDLSWVRRFPDRLPRLDYFPEFKLKINYNGRLKEIKLTGLPAFWASSLYELKDGVHRIKEGYLEFFIELDAVTDKFIPYSFLNFYLLLPDEDYEMVSKLLLKEKKVI